MATVKKKALRRILVVDDDPVIRSSLGRSLRRGGFEPLVAASGEEAIALAEELSLHAVIADMRMPGMGGAAMLQRLDQLHPEARFIVLSGAEVDGQVLPRGHRLAVLQKPYEPERLLELLVESPEFLSIYPPAISNRNPIKVLLVEDDQADAVLFKTALRRTKIAHDVHHYSTLAEATQALNQEKFDVACVDLHLPDARGLDILFGIQATAPHLGVVVLSHQQDSEVAIQAVQAGAHDFLLKGRADGDTIAKTLRYARERKRSEIRLSEMAFYDPLTLLPNRMLFRQRVAQAASRARRSGTRFAVLLLDMDRFKSINDALGHDAGDAFLHEVGARLKRVIRGGDLAARLGGDEFAAVVENLDDEGHLELVADRILKTLREPFQIGSSHVASSASIGAAIFPESGTDSDTLLAAADAAMYVRKSRGRDGMHVHGVELTQELAQRLSLEQELRTAVAEQQFELHYQPIVDQWQNWIAAEALLRWRSPIRGLVAANEFIPTLEESGILEQLNPWIFEEASRQICAWRAAGIPIQHIAVNVSAGEFRDGRLVEEVLAAVNAGGAGPKDIELELTETALLHDAGEVEVQLRALAGYGFRIALDDFGTGYSSLTHLCQFPISTVKIDRSFVGQLMLNNSARQIAGAILQLAERLQLNVVAEGVEEVGQVLLLQEDGGCSMQGYLFSRPRTAQDFEAHFRSPQQALDVRVQA